jgi:hypothetical protein
VVNGDSGFQEAFCVPELFHADQFRPFRFIISPNAKQCCQGIWER